jgi:hypothetical protein
MEKEIRLKSKGGEHNYLKLMNKVDGSESKTYLLKTESPIISSGFADNGKKYIIPPGGPLFQVGEFCEQVNARVRFIDWVYGYGYFIEFE